jgi:putative FmdB family regulatory protein
MPLYDYKCEFCDFSFEIRKSIKHADEFEGCPQCGSECKRQITLGSGFILKGDGWASDGYSDKIKTDNKSTKEKE